MADAALLTYRGPAEDTDDTRRTRREIALATPTTPPLTGITPVSTPAPTQPPPLSVPVPFSPAPWSPRYANIPTPAAPPVVPTPNYVVDPSGRNNPGNIKIPGTNQFQRFPTPQAGFDAIGQTLLAYQDQHGLNTVAGIITRYSPPTENNTDRLIANAAARMGVDPNQPLDMHDPATRKKMINAIVVQEQQGGVSSLPQQQYIPAAQTPGLNNRPPNQWGRTPEGGYQQGPPGHMPSLFDIPRIMAQGLALLPLLSLFTKGGLIPAMTAFGSYVKGYQSGQLLRQKLDENEWKNNLDETISRMERESIDYGDAFATYEGNEQALTQALTGVANKYDDQPMLMALANGGSAAAQRLMQGRDHYFTDLNKTQMEMLKLQLAQQEKNWNDQLRLAEYELSLHRSEREDQEAQRRINEANAGLEQVNKQRAALGLPPVAAPAATPTAPAQPTVPPPPGTQAPTAQPAQPSPPSAPAAAPTQETTQPPAQPAQAPAAPQQPPPTPAQPATTQPEPATPPPTTETAATETETVLGAPDPSPAVVAGVPNWKGMTPQEQSIVARTGERIAQGEPVDWKGIPEDLQTGAQVYASQVQNNIDALNRSNLRGPALMQRMKEIDPYRAQLVQAMVDGRYEEPAGFSARSPFWQGVLALANKIDPTLDANTFRTRGATLREFATGADGRNLTAVATAERHLESLEALVKDKPGLWLPFGLGGTWVNTPYNWAVTGLLGRTRAAEVLGKYSENATAASNEMATALASGRASTQAERDRWHNAFAASNTRNVLIADIEQARVLLQGRIKSLEERFAAGTGRPTSEMLPLFERYSGSYDAGTIKRLQTTQPGTPATTTPNWPVRVQ